MPVSLRVYTDGASRGNPGEASLGVVVCDASDGVLREHREYLGRATNNEAEHRAVLRGLRLAAALGGEVVHLVSDSELVVRQLTGEYRIREERLRVLADEVREAASAFQSVTYEHLPRMTGHLRRADELANEALDRRSSVQPNE